MSPEISAELAHSALARQIAYLRMPASGNASLAHAGSLTCFVSGPRPAFGTMWPLLASFTRVQTYLGEAEQACYAKLAVNLMIAVSAGMMAEGLALARKGGVLATLMRATYETLIAKGESETDFIATVRQAERSSGIGEPDAAGAAGSETNAPPGV